MINKKVYYSISEVSKLIGVQEHTIRFWDSKLPGLSRQSEKGKTRFFSQHQVNKLLNISDILKNNDSLSLAYQIASKNKLINAPLRNLDSKDIKSHSVQNSLKLAKIKEVVNNLKHIINS